MYKLIRFTSIAVPGPLEHSLTMDEVYDGRQGPGKPNHERLRAQLVGEGKVDEEVALRIVREGIALLRAEDNIVEVEAPITGIFFNVVKYIFDILMNEYYAYL